MKSAEIIADIFKYVRKNGILVNKAKSCWGADRWSLDGVVDVTLEDDGYTQGVFATDVKVRSTYGRKPSFLFGDVEKLKKLHKLLLTPSK